MMSKTTELRSLKTNLCEECVLFPNCGLRTGDRQKNEYVQQCYKFKPKDGAKPTTKPLSMEAFEAVTHEQIDRCFAVLLKKSKEYSTKTDKLHNFRLAAGLQGCSEKEALFGMWAKHLVSLSDMCRSDSTYDLALWEEKITDTINYALLLYGLVREEAEYD